MTDGGGDLYKFAPLNFAKDGSPTLLPPGAVTGPSAGEIAKNSLGFHQINVINNFQWTTSPQTSRMDTPSIQLIERKLMTNSLVAQALYNIAAIKDSTKQAGKAFEGLSPEMQTALKGVGGAILGNKTVNTAIPDGSLFTKLVTALTSAGVGALTPNSTIAAAAGTFTNFISQSIKSISGPGQNATSSLNSTVLTPYEGLYITEPTKFIYTLPYFSDTQNRVVNAFQDNDAVFEGSGESTATPAVEGLTQAMLATRGFAQGLARTAFFGAPGIYIEKPKYYNFNNLGEKISVRFPLVNTGWATPADVARNWQLLFMLTYQNRPNRKSRDLVDPSVLYEVNIPGIKYHPFAYVDSLIIRFRGARRQMTITIPGPNGSTTTVNTIIPDAYDVELSLQTLINESQNTLYSMLFEKNDLITVTQNGAGAAGAGSGGSLPLPGGNLPLPNSSNTRLPVQAPGGTVPSTGGRLTVNNTPTIEAPRRP